MNKHEVNTIMTYCFCERGGTVTEDRLQVWYDLLKDVPLDVARIAARVLTARIAYVPTVHDFLKAIAEVTTPVEDKITWGQAWDVWVAIACRHGWYNKHEAIKQYIEVCPLGAQALGSSASEYFTLKTEELGTFKAQFRGRFEGLQARANNIRVLPRELVRALGYEINPKWNKVLQLRSDIKALESVEKDGNL